MDIDKFPVKLQLIITHIPSGMQWINPPTIVNSVDEFNELNDVCEIAINPANNKFSIPLDEFHTVFIPRGILQESIVILKKLPD